MTNLQQLKEEAEKTLKINNDLIESCKKMIEKTKEINKALEEILFAID